VALICVGDEEIGSSDSAPLTARWAMGASAALVFEAGRARDAIITQRRGTGAVKLGVRGKAAHAGNHHADGINAIWALARLVDAAQRLTDYERGVTLNVGVIQGGSSKNTVPEHAEAQLDLRFTRSLDGEQLMEQLKAQAAQLADETGAEFSIEGGIRRPPLEKTEASSQLYARYAACARESGLEDVESPLLGGGSDANNIAALGVPAIDGLGPRGAGFHTHDEYIEPSSLPLKTAALLRFLLRHARA
jgi:glutamate carboxypeptidase